MTVARDALFEALGRTYTDDAFDGGLEPMFLLMACLVIDADAELCFCYGIELDDSNVFPALCLLSAFLSARPRSFSIDACVSSYDRNKNAGQRARRCAGRVRGPDGAVQD